MTETKVEIIFKIVCDKKWFMLWDEFFNRESNSEGQRLIPATWKKSHVLQKETKASDLVALKMCVWLDYRKWKLEAGMNPGALCKTQLESECTWRDCRLHGSCLVLTAREVLAEFLLTVSWMSGLWDCLGTENVAQERAADGKLVSVQNRLVGLKPHSVLYHLKLMGVN